MDEETLRQMAITQYLQGKKPISIYRDLGKTKKWFFKWLKRYRSGDEHWYRDLSRAPLSHPNQTSPDTSQLIASIRNDLDSSYAQIGVTAIRWEGQKLGISLPSDSTINRILKREDLVKKNPLSPERGRVSLLPGILWASTIFIRPISSVPGISKTTVDFILCISSIGAVIGFLSIPNAGKTIYP